MSTQKLKCLCCGRESVTKDGGLSIRKVKCPICKRLTSHGVIRKPLFPGQPGAYVPHHD